MSRFIIMTAVATPLLTVASFGQAEPVKKFRSQFIKHANNS